MAGDGLALASADDSDAAHIFREVVAVQVKPVGRDAFQALLTIRLRPDDPAHPRSLLIELTDEADLLFYHSLVLGEGDFHALKAEQRLRVDFQSFPTQVAELLRRCCTSATELANSAVGAMPGVPRHFGGTASGTSPEGGLRMLACLDCGASGESLLSIVEANQFRELTHISLRLRHGTDEVVKQHLAGKLRVCKAECVELAEQLHASDKALSQARHEVEELGARGRVVAEERQHLERSLREAHEAEVAGLRREQASALAEQQRNAAAERHRFESESRGSLDEALARASRAERVAEELQQQRQALAASNASLQERLDSSEAGSQTARRELQELREQHKELELLKFQHERQLGELRVQVSSLQEQLAGKVELISSQAAQADSASAQRKNLEEMLGTCRQHMQALEEKFAMATQEIVKGNEIIQSLHVANKQLKAKSKAKLAQLAQQEKAVLELEKAGEINKHVLQDKDQEISRAKDRETKLQMDAEELKKKLADAHEVLKSNQDAIEFLNRQLTERDLRAIPQIPRQADAAEVGRGGSSSLAELLRRAEGAGRSLQLSGGGGASRGGTSAAALGLSPEVTGGAPSSLGITASSLGSTGLAGTRVLAGLGGGVADTLRGGAGTGTAPAAAAGGLGAAGLVAALTPERPSPLTGARGSSASSPLPGSCGLSLGLGGMGTSLGAALAVAGPARDPFQGPITYRRPGGPGEETRAVA
mmetsp:Transcript_86272/g.217118  ORF Transcript_86272/g.217118 Transcript_86272/m.217118 type:complete len:712 (-) Transcript_86272:185-2320(-)|eukprot:CAMPEP_0115216664 /NCGR_PEP_ID=MMETSP0270-20121206/25456_1 /TAXON_ID=71861 /ORGANISM="Scrippsiella trochoidea, Strain CCMP3099" /LENGTH=711 /DNA_ID=CAMNT_0002630511 /DNA_START=99 /DNA_END=2234 /DNA_ORIENTATION=-